MNADHEIREKMQELVRCRRKGLFIILAGVVCLAVLPALEYFTVGNNWEPGWMTGIRLLAGFALLIYGFIVWANARGRLKDLISETFVPEALSKVFTQVEYRQNSHVPRESIDATLIQHYWDSTRGNDYVWADYRGIPIEFSDLRLTYETGIGDKRRTRSAFLGPYIICSFAQSFPAELVLVNRKKTWLGVKNLREELQPISSGYEALDDKFLLFADNSQGAQSILTPRAAQSILQLCEYTEGNCNMKFTRDGKVHVAVNSGRNAFEPGKRIEEAEQKIAEEVRYVTDIFDLLCDAMAQS